MKNEPDRSIHPNREQALIVTAPPTSWPPMSAPGDLTTSHEHWLTRGARGISWHRSGRASQGRLQ